MLELGGMVMFCTLTGPLSSVTTGPLCDVCDEGSFYNPETDFCESCTMSSDMEEIVNPTSIIAMFFALIVFVCIGLFTYQVLKWETNESAEAQNCKDKVEAKGNGSDS